jgi:hypothetical protein
VRARTRKSLNNLIEQDHRRVKQAGAVEDSEAIDVDHSLTKRLRRFLQIVPDAAPDHSVFVPSTSP